MAEFDKVAIKLLDSVGVGIVLYGSTGKILRANSFFENISGYINDDLLNMDIDVIFGSEIFLSEEKKSFKRKLICRNKEPIEILIRLNSLTIDNEKIGIVTVISLNSSEIEFTSDPVDSLTGALTRKSFMQEIDEYIEKSKKNGDRLVVISVKLDRIGSINQYAGYDVGDALIAEAVRRLRSSISPNAKIGRIAGNRFTVFYSMGQSSGIPADVCKGIVTSLSESILVKSVEFNLAASLGAALYPQDGLTSINLIDAADKALEEAEIRGHNRFQFFNNNISKKLEKLNLIDVALPMAISRDEFKIEYQPIVLLNDKSIIGAEALLRWENPDLGNISPNEFIPRAENMGLIIPIGEWVLNNVCIEVKKWEKITNIPIRFGVNFSAVQMAQEDIATFIEKTLLKYGISPELLDIELTEHSLSTDPMRAIQSITQLKKMGMTFSLDDFGTGYSTLSQLASYPVNTLKIDQSFISGLSEDSESVAIVKAIVQMANDLGLSILAEGVETHGQVEFLLNLGCDYAQGHYFYSSMSGNEFRQLLTKN